MLRDISNKNGTLHRLRIQNSARCCDFRPRGDCVTKTTGWRVENDVKSVSARRIGKVLQDEGISQKTCRWGIVNCN